MFETKISNWGNSKAIRIPMQVINQLNLEVNQPLDVEIANHSIIITPKLKEPETIEELYADYDFSSNDYEGELDWGRATGEELEW